MRKSSFLFLVSLLIGYFYASPALAQRTDVSEITSLPTITPAIAQTMHPFLRNQTPFGGRVKSYMKNETRANCSGSSGERPRKVSRRRRRL